MDSYKSSKTTHVKGDDSETNTLEKDSLYCLFYAQINLNWSAEWQRD